MTNIINKNTGLPTVVFPCATERQIEARRVLADYDIRPRDVVCAAVITLTGSRDYADEALIRQAMVYLTAQAHTSCETPELDAFVAQRDAQFRRVMWPGAAFLFCLVVWVVLALVVPATV